MSFDPKDYVAVAEHLRRTADNGCPHEAALRVAMGRYYYAALLCTRRHLSKSTMQDDFGETTHRTVLGRLRESAEPESQLLFSGLNRMRELRNQADYGDAFANLSAEVDRMAKLCHKALGHVATLERRARR